MLDEFWPRFVHVSPIVVCFSRFLIFDELILKNLTVHNLPYGQPGYNNTVHFTNTLQLYYKDY